MFLFNSMCFFLSQVDVNIDLSEIVSERLSAMRKLQENPNDNAAKSKLDTVQKTVSDEQSDG